MSKKIPVVAIVDDDPIVLGSLEELLESAGYVVRSFSAGGLLLASGLSGVDVLITDIGLPGIDGFELRDVVKEKYPELPVFMITGRHEIADQSRAQRADGFFRKPCDGQALLTAVGDVLRDN